MGSGYLKRGISFLRRNGIAKTLYKAAERLDRDRKEADYVPVHADEETLKMQREHTFRHPHRISILVPVHETDPAIFRAMLESVGKQTYGNWELILADSSRDESRRGTVLEFTEKYNMLCRDSFGGIHDKVRYIRTLGAKGISANTNEALAAASGDYIALLDHDDILEDTALFDIMEAVEEKEQSGQENETLSRAMLIYTDEDKVSADGGRYFDPHIKPDFDPVLLCTNNYICHFLVVNASVAKSVGGFRPEFDGAQDHDFILRCTESIKRDEIVHVRKVLYHWRSTAGSTSENPDAKLYAYEAGREAVRAHLERAGIYARVTNSPHLGYFDISYDRLHRKVVTLTPEEVEKYASDTPEQVRSEYLLVLSQDLEPLDPDHTADMMSCMQLPGIGAVTGKITDRSRKIESAGFETDGQGRLVPSFSGLNEHFSGYMHGASVDRLTKGFSQDCVLLRPEAVSELYPEIRLKDGFDIYYMHRAVFRRKTR